MRVSLIVKQSIFSEIMDHLIEMFRILKEQEMAKMFKVFKLRIWNVLVHCFDQIGIEEMTIARNDQRWQGN